MDTNKKGFASPLLLFIVVLLAVGGWLIYSGKIQTPRFNTKSEKSQVSNTRESWQVFSGADGKFSINYPPTWEVTKMPESEDFIGMKLEGKEGYVDLMWGGGLGGACPSGYEKLQVKNREIPVCHEFMEDETEHWRDISRDLDKETGFSGRGVAYTPVSKNRETILKILSTLDFASK